MKIDLTGKDGAAIMLEIHGLTREMVDACADADFLLSGVQDRQEMMDVYDAWANENPQTHAEFVSDVKIRQMVDEVLSMDRLIVEALEGFKREIEKDSTATKAQNKVMGYLGNAISASGSYMDVKLK